MADNEHQSSSKKYRRLIIIILVSLIILAAILVPITSVAINQRQAIQSTYSSTNAPGLSNQVDCGTRICPANVNQRIDCHPEPNATQSSCTKRGCCWQQSNSVARAPSCFFPVGNHGYSATTNIQATDVGFTVTLRRCNTPQYLRNGLLQLAIEVEIRSNSMLRIKVSAVFIA